MYIYVYVHMYIRTQLKKARDLRKHDPEALAAQPALKKKLEGSHGEKVVSLLCDSTWLSNVHICIYVHSYAAHRGAAAVKRRSFGAGGQPLSAHDIYQVHGAQESNVPRKHGIFVTVCALMSFFCFIEKLTGHT